MQKLLRKFSDAVQWRARIERDFLLGVLRVIYRAATTLDNWLPLWVIRIELLLLAVLSIKVLLDNLVPNTPPF